MDRFDPFLSVAVALGSGLLIGLERERSAVGAEGEPREISAGARTHALVALIGALSVILGKDIGEWLVAIPLVGLIAFLSITYADDVKKGKDRGLTSELAILMTFILGALSTSPVLGESPHRLVAVSGLAVAITTLLSLKGYTHGLARKVSRADVYSTLKFLIAAIIVLPLLPNKTYGPLDTLNPFQTGTMIILIAGIGFVGYLAVRLLGPGRGLGVTGLVGGLVSSTAVTLSMAARAKKDAGVAGSCALAVLMASTVMYGRVLVEVAVVHRPLVVPLLLPLGAMLLGGAGVGGLLYYRSRGVKAEAQELDVSNPFELSSAVKFGLLYAFVKLGSKAANVYLGPEGAYLAGALAGLTDVDAITLTMADLVRTGLDPAIAVRTIVLAVVSNTIVKGSMAAALGGWLFARFILLGFAISLVLGAAVAFLG